MGEDERRGPDLLPEHPDFANAGEQQVWSALAGRAGNKDPLGRLDTLMHDVQLADRDGTEHRLDLLVMMPLFGATVIACAPGTLTASQLQALADRAQAGAVALRRLVERSPQWAGRPRLRATWMVAVPDMTVDPAVLPPRRVLDRSTVGRPGQRIAALLDDYPVHRDGTLPSFQIRRDGGLRLYPWVDDVIDVLLTDDDSVPQVPPRTPRFPRKWGRFQQQALDSEARRLTISGSAGTGKTTVGAALARDWAAAGDRVCVVTRRSAAAEHIRRLVGPETTVAFIGTFDELMAHHQALPPRGPGEPAHGFPFWRDTAPGLLTDAAAALPDDQRYTAFVLDQVEHYIADWVPAILTLADRADPRLALLVDERSQHAPVDHLLPTDLGTRLVLNENYRASTRITHAVRSVNKEAATGKRSFGLHVRHVDVPVAGLEAALAAVLADLLEVRETLPEDIAVLDVAQAAPPVPPGWTLTRWWDADDVVRLPAVKAWGLERSTVVVAVDPTKVRRLRDLLAYAMSVARDELVVLGPLQQMDKVNALVAHLRHQAERENADRDPEDTVGAEQDTETPDTEETR